MSTGAAEAGIEEAALCLLTAYPFPGNVRELMSILQSAANLARGRLVTAGDLPREVATASGSKQCRPPAEHTDHRPLGAVEQEHILSVYRATGRNKARTARTLGIGLNTLRRKLRGYGKT